MCSWTAAHHPHTGNKCRSNLFEYIHIIYIYTYTLVQDLLYIYIMFGGILHHLFAFNYIKKH